jgi:hypothetical protein
MLAQPAQRVALTIMRRLLSVLLVPDQLPEAALEKLRAQVAKLRAANARLRDVIEAKDAQLAVAQAAGSAAEARFAR